MQTLSGQKSWFLMDLKFRSGKYFFRLKLLGGFGFVSVIVTLTVIFLAEDKVLDVLQLLLGCG